MVIQMKNQTVDIKVLLYQKNTVHQYFSTSARHTIVKFVCMTMSRSTIMYNQFITVNVRRNSKGKKGTETGEASASAASKRQRL